MKSFNCPNCTATLIPIEGKHYMFCQYCGSKIAMDEIEFYREDAITERVKIEADKEERMHKESEKTKRESNEQKSEFNNNLLALIFFFFAMIFFGGCVLVALLA